MMSKTNETSRDELTIDELDAVSGGIIAVLIGLLLPSPPPPPPPPVQR